MTLIIGGAYQGKLEYARGLCPNAPVIQCGEKDPELDLPDESCVINAFHLFVLARVRAGSDALDFLKANMGLLRNKTIICDDISCGIVPMSPEARQWRESVGRCMGYLSVNAESVIRLFCGIAGVLK